MSTIDSAQALLTEGFNRVDGLVAGVTEGLTTAVATYRPNDEANTVAWLIWHLTRVQDDHLAELAQAPQVWEQWRKRFDLPFAAEATGYGQSAADVSAVRADAELLAGYHGDVHDATVRYLDQLTADDLERVVDDRWDPPVTVLIRLISVLSDTLQHAGQAAYVRGLAERASR